MAFEQKNKISDDEKREPLRAMVVEDRQTEADKATAVATFGLA